MARCRRASFSKDSASKTTPEVSEDISGALKRLIGGGRGGMGSMFKVLAISEPHLTSLAGLSDPERAARVETR